MKHCQKDQLLEATLPSHDFISSLMIFSAFIRASASQLLNLGCKLFKNQTKTKPSFPASMFSEKKPKNITFNNSQTVKIDEPKAHNLKTNRVIWGHDFQQPDPLHQAAVLMS